MSDSVRPHRRQPTRLPRPWDSPGKNTGVGCHFLLQRMEVKSEREVAQSCLTLCNPIDGSPPGSPVPGILQARILEWVAISFSNYFVSCFLYAHFWRRQWHPTPVLLPGKSHGRRSLVGCSPWGRTESDMTEVTW